LVALVPNLKSIDIDYHDWFGGVDFVGMLESRWGLESSSRAVARISAVTVRRFDNSFDPVALAGLRGFADEGLDLYLIDLVTFPKR